MTGLSIIGIVGWLVLASYPVTNFGAVVIGAPLVAVGALGTWVEWRDMRARKNAPPAPW